MCAQPEADVKGAISATVAALLPSLTAQSVPYKLMPLGFPSGVFSFSSFVKRTFLLLEATLNHRTNPAQHDDEMVSVGWLLCSGSLHNTSETYHCPAHTP